jgi:sugar phosphate isomerase/epimerase
LRQRAEGADVKYSYRILESELTAKILGTINRSVESIELELPLERLLELGAPANAGFHHRITSVVIAHESAADGQLGPDPIASINNALSVTRSIGAETLVVPMDVLLTGKPASDGPLHFAASRLLELRFEAQRRAVSLACEVRPPYLISPMEAREFFDRVNSPFVGAGINLAKFACEQDAADYVTEMTHRIAHVHLSLDARRDAELAQWTDLLTAIRYSGPFSLSGNPERIAELAKLLSAPIAYNSEKV